MQFPPVIFDGLLGKKKGTWGEKGKEVTELWEES